MDKNIKIPNNKEENLLVGFLAGVFVVFTIAYLLEEDNERSKKRLRKLAKESNNGFENDRKMLTNDWQIIQNDFNKNFERIKINYE
jgi:gas vesicle protein